MSQNYHFWLKNDGEKWSRIFILKFTKPPQRYLLTCRANSAFLGRFFALGSSNSEGHRGILKYFFSRPLFTIMVTNLRKISLCIVWHQKPTVNMIQKNKYLGTVRKRRRLECLPVDCQKAAEPGRVRLFLKLFKLRITFLWGVTLLIRGWCISWSEMTSEAGSWNKITSKSLGYSAITFCLSRISNCSLGVFCNAAKINQVCISYPASEYVSSPVL